MTEKIEIICENCGKKRLITKKSFLRNKRDGIKKCVHCYNDENYKSMMSIKSNKAWLSEDLKNKVRNISKNWAYNNRKIISEKMKEIWNDDDYKLNQIIKQKITHPKIIKILKYKKSIDELKNEASKKTSEIWKNKNYINKQIEIHKHQKVDNDFKRKISESLKIKWNDEDYRNKMKIMFSERLKKLWKNDEYRIKAIKAIESSKGKVSSIEIVLSSILDDLKIKYEFQKSIGFFIFDFLLPDYNILIECNGDYWHSLPKAINNDKAKSSYITNNFSEYKLHYIWEHEFKCKDKVVELIKYWTGTKFDMIDFDFKDLIIKITELKDARLFVDKYHYSGTIGNSTYRYGCYLNNELIALCSFGNITRNESAIRLNMKLNELLELTRFCIHPKYQKKNLASWLISRCIDEIKKLNKYKCLISFADTTFNHNGTIYKASNWINDGVVSPSYWYIDKDGYVMHKKTLWDNAKKMSMTENEYSCKYCYKKISGKEKIRYVYYL
jgi:very-short-patch-repair endonuclease